MVYTLQALPTPFYTAHLPPKDTIMVLETKTGEQYEAKYLARHFRLSGGWRKFARDNKLEAGDVVVFTLVEATKFKVVVGYSLSDLHFLLLKLVHLLYDH